MHTSRASILVILLMCSTAAVSAPSQNIYASLTGVVVDQSGAVIPGVTITAMHSGTGFTRTAVTDERGNYLLTLLPIGSYSLSAELPGFKREVRTGITLQVDQRAREDFRLQVGQVSEVLEVSAAAPLVESETSSVGNVIDNTKVAELPLNGREFTQLALLVPGAMPTSQGSTHSFRGGFNVAGAREMQNNFLLDGVDNNDNTVGIITVRPSMEIIQEFKVQTNSYAADAGRFAGGQINISTKSGTNELHGSLLGFIRNQALDAKNFFDNPNNPIPPFKRSQFGGSLGGPIVRNRTFFFGAYEGIRIRQAQTLLASVPTPQMVRGDFSGLLSASNPWTRAVTRINDPLTGQPFPNNVIPASRIDSVGAKVAARYPLPNRLEDPIRNFISNPKYTENTDQYNFRVDHELNNRIRVFGRYSLTNNDVLDAYDQLGRPTNLPGYGRSDDLKTQNAAVVTTVVFNSKTISELRLGYNRHRQIRVPEDLRDGVKELGLQGVDPFAHVGHNTGWPLFRITGFDAIGPAGNNPQVRMDNTYQIVENFSYTTGAHALKVGFDLLKFQQFDLQNSNIRGNFQFVGRYSGFALADLLLGYPNQAQRLIIPEERNYQYHYSHGFYALDDWKVLPTLTLNLGVRYELDMPIKEVFNRVSRFDPEKRVIEISPVKDPRYDVTKGTVVPIGLPIVVRNSNTLRDPDKNDFAPRVGFAWRPFNNNQSVVRGGYGFFYEGLLQVGGPIYALPWRFAQTFNGDLTRPNLVFPNPFNESAGLSPLSPSGFPSSTARGYVQHFNVGVQREVVRDLLVEIAYVGSKGTKLKRSRNINQPLPGPGAVDARRPYLGFGSISYSEWSASSTYHSMQVRVEKRTSKNMTFLSAYTFGKSLDDDSASEGNGGAAPQNTYNLRENKGLSSFDVRHRLVFSYVYKTPFGRGQRFGSSWPAALQHLLGGWESSGVITLMSGRPFTALLSRDNSGTAVFADRPNRVGDAHLAKHDPSQWLNTAAFVIPPRGEYGNAGRNTLIGPGLSNVDFSLLKNHRLRENQNVQFRAEFFNLFNHPNFLLPNRIVDSPQFGKIFAAGPSRQIQFGLRYAF